MDLIDGYNCSCSPGYYGLRCESEIRECASNPCQNSAPCVDLINAYFCNCTAGYEGADCQQEIDECANNPCLNEGKRFSHLLYVRKVTEIFF